MQYKLKIQIDCKDIFYAMGYNFNCYWNLKGSIKKPL